MFSFKFDETPSLDIPQCSELRIQGSLLIKCKSLVNHSCCKLSWNMHMINQTIILFHHVENLIASMVPQVWYSKTKIGVKLHATIARISTGYATTLVMKIQHWSRWKLFLSKIGVDLPIANYKKLNENTTNPNIHSWNITLEKMKVDNVILTFYAEHDLERLEEETWKHHKNCF